MKKDRDGRGRRRDTSLFLYLSINLSAPTGKTPWALSGGQRSLASEGEEEDEDHDHDGDQHADRTPLSPTWGTQQGSALDATHTLIIHILIVVSKGKLSGITAHRSARVEREKEMKAASKFSPNFAKKKREFPQRKIKVVYIQWVQTCGNRAVFNYTTGTSDGLDVVCNYTVITFLNSRFTWSWCDYTRINKFIPPEIKSISFSKSECGDNCVEAGHIVHYKWSLKPLIITLKHGIIDLVACFALCTVLLLVGLKTHQVNVLKVWKWPFPWSTLSRVLPTCLCQKPAAVTFNI